MCSNFYLSVVKNVKRCSKNNKYALLNFDNQLFCALMRILVKFDFLSKCFKVHYTVLGKKMVN